MTAIVVAFDRSMFLRRALIADAALCFATGTLLGLLAAPASRLFGLPAELLFYAGVGLLPTGVFMAWAGTRKIPPTPAVWLVVFGNALWVAASVFVLFVFATSALGTALVVAQAVVVALLAELEWVGLNRSRSS